MRANEARESRDRAGAFAPAGPAHTARIEKMTRAAAREAKTIEAAAMQEIGVLDGSDKREASLDAGGLRIVGNSVFCSPQGR